MCEGLYVGGAEFGGYGVVGEEEGEDVVFGEVLETAEVCVGGGLGCAWGGAGE